ncbi:ABC transporter substrate-binding protein [Frankia sp. CNm7]|uniref:ABC transporter substrate-binding protein n=1 Tax=Frankia nepalensis TaxID=1836974 RepID=A0A937RNG6_9ACTN|nr:ABC transporter substrate-binding protein [Frankia nepalensis]MBL7499167.1 ABC transporter substrate-binding protein [Frankia nepalensis]MBL7511015.1 ABC transporter substrate-binding protein [Frankia nepalensis]MBL7520517.1 ABC transporter substrate-binding protein [Frankia nepalensis]MBL7632095.1 ABC transporter substrate-binding protein [Frankia nepalensis]
MPTYFPLRPHRPHSRHSTALTAAAAVLAAAAASGCAGDNGAPGAGNSCNAPGVSADEIRIGLVFPNDGTIGAALKSARSGVDARLGLVNEAGGIHGRKITYVWRDDQGTAQANNVAVQELVGSADVFALLEASTGASGGADYLRSQSVPAIGLPIESIWADPAYPNMFTFPSLVASGSASDVFGRYVLAQGGSRAVIVSTDSVVAAQRFTPLIGQSLAASRIPTTQLAYNSTITNPARFAEQLRESDADVLVLDLPPADGPQILAAARAAGLTFRVVLAAAGYGKETIERYGASVAGFTTFSIFVPFEAKVPAQREYLDAAQRHAPELQSPSEDVAYGTYIATDILVRGLTDAGPCPTREGFVQALRAVTDYNAGGLVSGRLTFDKNVGQPFSCLIFSRVNAAGTAFEVVPNTTPGAPSPTEWCGERLAGAS